ncbi:helix-turn-helix domain-containing protein [Streptomyces sp. NPDC057682]|uniref:helix-turn-helix domain-containing protein n=1 Tax=unclassified Streptomyces TaxID=2593676 RepID=UPI00365E4F6B
MMTALLDLDGLPPRDRLTALNEMFLTSKHPMGVVGDEADGFAASLRGVELASVHMAELTMSPGKVVRSERMVRQADPELVSVVVAASGSVVLSQAGRDAVLDPTTLALYDSSYPYEIRLDGDGGTATLLRAHIPRTLLGRSPARLRPLLARPLPGRDGFAGMVVHLMNSLAGEAHAYGSHDLPRLSEISGDLLTALVTHHLDERTDPEDPSGRGALLLSIEAFVRQRLHDPELSPRVIAGAHHLSVGHLHRLFHTRGTTPAAWIRGLRLTYAGRDLRDPALREVTVHQIATRWGFRDHSTFTRSFRTAYGMSPRDYRHVPPGPGGVLPTPG